MLRTASASLLCGSVEYRSHAGSALVMFSNRAQQAQSSITQRAVVLDTRRKDTMKLPMQMQQCITPRSVMPDTRQ